MKKHTRTILTAVAGLLNMAVAAGGYMLMAFILAMFIIHPFWYTVAYLMLNVCTIIYHLSPLSDKVYDWFDKKVEGLYLKFSIWNQLRKAEYAEFEVVQ